MFSFKFFLVNKQNNSKMVQFRFLQLFLSSISLTLVSSTVCTFREPVDHGKLLINSRGYECFIVGWNTAVADFFNNFKCDETNTNNIDRLDVKILHFDYGHITHVPLKIYETFPSVEVMIFSDPVEIQSGGLDNLDELKLISVNQNKIKIATSGLKKVQKVIKIIGAHGKELKIMHKDTFEDFLNKSEDPTAPNSSKQSATSKILLITSLTFNVILIAVVIALVIHYHMAKTISHPVCEKNIIFNECDYVVPKDDAIYDEHIYEEPTNMKIY
jgi:hypothetical protein